MASKFGGVPVSTGGSRFGGVPVRAAPGSPEDDARRVAQGGRPYAEQNAIAERDAAEYQRKIAENQQGRQIGRTLALGGRSVLRGIASIPDLVISPLTALANKMGEKGPTTESLITGQQERYFPRQMNVTESVDYLADQLGAPRPETPQERVLSDINSAIVGTAGGLGVGQQLSRSANPVVSRIGQTLIERPGLQTAAAVSGAGASGVARESGAGPVGQTVAGLAGGLLPVGPAALAARRQVAIPRTDRRAGQILLSEASDPRIAVAPSATPGVQRTLGEATLDPGLMALENTIRSPNSALFTNIDRANNAARMAQLEGIAGTPASMSAAEQARETATDTLRNQAFREGAETQDRSAAAYQESRAFGLGTPAAPSPMQGLRNRVAAIARENAPRPTVQTAVNDVSNALSKAGDNVSDLYMVRQYIGDLLSGKAGGDKSAARLASKELLQIRAMLDAELAMRAPSFPGYLSAYQAASKPINRMEVGRELMERASATPDPTTGYRNLTPNQFSKATNDLDAIAAQATGFAKAKASEILTPQDLKSIRAIQDDLERRFARESTRPSGSPTQGLQEATKRMALKSAAQSLPMGIGDFFKLVESNAQQQTQSRLAYLIANPNEAKRVMSALRPQDKQALQSVLSRISTLEKAAPGIIQGNIQQDY